MKIRKIKFRAYGEYISGKGKEMVHFGLSSNIFLPKNEENFEFSQFIGLKDKNDEDIYEGDIVEKRDFITGITQYYQIIWSDDDCGFIGKGKNDSLFNGLGIISKELEIIGNIYENPNLAIK